VQLGNLKNVSVGEADDVLQHGDDPEAEEPIQAGQSEDSDGGLEKREKGDE
jgi:hypothetical protein